MTTSPYLLSSDVEYLSKLEELVQQDSIKIEFNPKVLAGLDSPVAVEADGNRWAIGLIIVVGAALWLGGAWAGFGAGLAGAVIYATVGRKHLASLIKRRIHQKALKDIVVWRRLWEHGGINLIAADEKNTAAPLSVAPPESWIKFIDGIIQRRLHMSTDDRRNY